VDGRINELESRLAFQDDTLQALNDALVAPQRLLERVQLQMAALIKRQEEVGSQFGMAEDEAPPPHY
jgi:SlyX protein